jgi:hypothetical protein
MYILWLDQDHPDLCPIRHLLIYVYLVNESREREREDDACRLVLTSLTRQPRTRNLHFYLPLGRLQLLLLEKPIRAFAK